MKREEDLRRRDKVREYNREYRKKKRAEALAREQTKWTNEQWDAWEKKQAAKLAGPGSAPWLLREVVKLLASKNGLAEDFVMERIIALGGVEFLTKGTQSLGKARAQGFGMVKGAAAALELYLDPDHAEMFKERRGDGETGNRERGIERNKLQDTVNIEAETQDVMHGEHDEALSMDGGDDRTSHSSE